jgi:hypothetical protein
MIYIERICDDHDIFSIERQKNGPYKEWYGITLCSDGESIADNEDWIFKELLFSLHYDRRKSKQKIWDELGLGEYNKEDGKAIKKLLQEAFSLNWY